MSRVTGLRPGPFGVGVTSVQFEDRSRVDDDGGACRRLQTEIWYPAHADRHGANAYSEFLGPRTASIVAKVWRDAHMRELAERYAGYGLDQHMGYATRQHLDALQRLGATPVHRRSFAPVARAVGSVEPAEH